MPTRGGWARPDLNRRSSLCESDVLTAGLRALPFRERTPPISPTPRTAGRSPGRSIPEPVEAGAGILFGPELHVDGGRDAPPSDRPEQRRVVGRRLVGVRGPERRQRLFEARLFPEIPADHRGVSGAGVGAGERGPAKLGLSDERLRSHAGDVGGEL